MDGRCWVTYLLLEAGQQTHPSTTNSPDNWTGVRQFFEFFKEPSILIDNRQVSVPNSKNPPTLVST
jgi:hypothetical protein